MQSTEKVGHPKAGARAGRGRRSLSTVLKQWRARIRGPTAHERLTEGGSVAWLWYSASKYSWERKCGEKGMVTTTDGVRDGRFQTHSDLVDIDG